MPTSLTLQINIPPNEEPIIQLMSVLMSVLNNPVFEVLSEEGKANVLSTLADIRTGSFTKYERRQ